MISFEEEMIACWCEEGGEGEGDVGDKGSVCAEDKDGHVCQLHPSPFPWAVILKGALIQTPCRAQRGTDC